MKVALDLEEVLANTIIEACSSTDNLEYDDFDEWSLTDYHWQVYAGVSDALWRHDPLSIPPVEPNVAEYVEDIYALVDTLDIVTARMHVDGNVKVWLDHHDIPYDNLVATREPKCNLDYDKYIDDNPEMVGDCSLFLRHHPHNDQIDVSDIDSCERIHSLAEVSTYL